METVYDVALELFDVVHDWGTDFEEFDMGGMASSPNQTSFWFSADGGKFRVTVVGE